ncbi:unnamed protein product [Strongylus vulgaris]|uniref:Uncharacterized protein n=1 Tax=Strongylus vulgaris TaxID=40348 RepID=A0A3P7K9K6_STRVU|nr:unnamed protein product [Strongylus vulgaris]
MSILISLAGIQGTNSNCAILKNVVMKVKYGWLTI